MLRTNYFIYSLLFKHIQLQSDATIDGTTLTVTTLADYQSISSNITESQIQTLIIQGEDVSFTTVDKIDNLAISKLVVNSTTTTTLGESLFQNNKYIKTVELSEHVTTIKSYCFDHSSIESINLEHVTTFESYTFRACNKLTDLSVYTANIPDYFATGSTNLKNVNLNEENVVIGQYVFHDCTSLSDLNYSKIISYGKYSFAYSSIKKVAISPGVTLIDERAFYCSQIISIDFQERTDSLTLSSESFSNLLITRIDLPSNFVLSSKTFCKNSKLVSVVLTYDYDTIPSECFSSCFSLKFFTAPGLKTLNEKVFYNCKSLKSISTSNLTEVGNSCFSYCESLEISVPVNISTIGDYAFSYCSKVNLPRISNTSVLGKYSFLGCSNLQKLYLRFSFGQGCFQGCQKVTDIIFENPVTEIPDFAFCNCSSLQKVSFNTNLTKIGKYSFSSCNLNNLVSLRYVETIDDYAFSYTKITSLLFSNLVSISEFSFYGVNSITKITLAKDCAYFDALPFAQTSGISIVTELKPRNVSITDDNLLILNGNTLICLLPEYSSSSFTIPEEITTVQKGFLALAKKVKTVEVSNDINLNKLSFYGSPYVKEVKISFEKTAFSEDETDILPSNFFANSDSLQTVTITTPIAALGEQCFTNCLKLKTLNLPQECQTFQSKVFYNCQKLSTVNLTFVNSLYPNCFENAGITTINLSNFKHLNESLFKDCKSFKTVDFTTIQFIGDNCFENCEKLSKVEITHSINLGDKVFLNCIGLKTAVLSGLYSIPDYCFDGCEKLNSVSFSDNLYLIGSYSFRKCNMKEIIIPDKTVSIGVQAFSYCPKLKKVTIGIGITQFSDDDKWFIGSSVEKLNLPSSLVDISQNSLNKLFNVKTINFSPESRLYKFGTNSLINKFSNAFYTTVGKLSLLFTIPENVEEIDWSGYKREKFIEETHVAFDQTFYDSDYRSSILKVPSSVKIIEGTNDETSIYKICYEGKYFQDGEFDITKKVVTDDYNNPLFSDDVYEVEKCKKSLPDEYKWRHIHGLSSAEIGLIAFCASALFLIILFIILYFVCPFGGGGKYKV